MTETTLLTDSGHTRKDLREVETAIRKSWQIPDALFERAGIVIGQILATGTNREKNAAARVLIAMNAQNHPLPTQSTAPVVNVGVQVNGSGNTDAGRTLASAIAERIRANRISQQPAG